MALYFVFYNFCRIHKSLRVTPAMAAGITDELMEMTHIVKLIDQAEEARTLQKERGLIAMLFAGYSNPNERVALVIGAASFLVNIVLALGLKSRVSHPAARTLLMLLAAVALVMSGFLLVGAFLAP